MSANGSFTKTIDFAHLFPAASNRPTAGNILLKPGAKRTVWSPGTGSKQINKWAYKAISFAATPQTIDFTAIVCGDDSVGFSHIRGIAIENAATNALHKITAGNATNPLAYWLSAATTTWEIDPGEVWSKELWLPAAGYVIDSSHKNLKLDPGAYTFLAYLFAWGD